MNRDGAKRDVPLSRSRLQQLFKDGCVRANDRPLKPSERLKPGDRIEVRIPEPSALSLTPEDRSVPILYEDDSIVVVNKPPGMSTHPSQSETAGTLVHALLHQIRGLSGIGGVLRPGIVHRLDKFTSGALVVAKTDQAHQKLSETFATHAIDREYWALCYGAPKPRPGAKASEGEYRIETKIGRNPRDRKKMSAEVTAGRRAVTLYRVRERYAPGAGTPTRAPFASWVQVRLETGRTHQIRVHLTLVHSSVLGDPVYGTPTRLQPKWKALPDPVREAVLAMPGQALHARVLGFAHPLTGKPLRFEAEPPVEFQKLHSALRDFPERNGGAP